MRHRPRAVLPDRPSARRLSCPTREESVPRMPTTSADRFALLQGTLDMLVLRALSITPLHGHAIATHIQRTSDDVLQVDHGSLYPALYRLQKRGWIRAKWEPMPDKQREAKYYRITAAGRRQLVRESSKWTQLATAIARVMRAGLKEPL